MCVRRWRLLWEILGHYSSVARRGQRVDRRGSTCPPAHVFKGRGLLSTASSIHLPPSSIHSAPSRDSFTTDTEQYIPSTSVAPPVTTEKPTQRTVEEARSSGEPALRLYFTKESHIHTLVNLVLYSGLPIANRRIPELDYCVRLLTSSGTYYSNNDFATVAYNVCLLPI